MLTQALIHPSLRVGRLEFRQGRGGQGFRLTAVFANQLIHSQFFNPEIILGGNFLGDDQVKTGLCLAGVGDGGGTHFKVAFG